MSIVEIVESVHRAKQVLRINASNCTASALVKVAELDWGVAEHRNLVARKTTPHVVVASDVVYEEQNIGAHKVLPQISTRPI